MVSFSPFIEISMHDTLFQKLGLDASAKRNADSARKYWEDEGVVFDVLAAPQVRKRDKDFEKFLLDDLGDVIDGSQTETVSRNEGYYKT